MSKQKKDAIRPYDKRIRKEQIIEKTSSDLCGYPQDKINEIQELFFSKEFLSKVIRAGGVISVPGIIKFRLSRKVFSDRERKRKLRIKKSRAKWEWSGKKAWRKKYNKYYWGRNLWKKVIK